MDIQWPLAFFTLLTGTGGWLLAFTAVNEFTRKSSKSGFNPALIGLILVILGGLASVLHLTHPTRIMNALSHPTSGIFVEAALCGIIAVCTVVYLICVKRDVKGGIKVFGVLSGVFGVLISFMAGESYMMAARLTWNTFLLPLGYLCTAIPAGALIYWALTVGEEASSKFMATATLVGGVLAALGSAAYSAVSGAFSIAIGFALGSILLAGIVPIIAGIVGRKKADLTIIGLALACAVVGALLYRVMMWVVGVSVYGFMPLS